MNMRRLTAALTALFMLLICRPASRGEQGMGTFDFENRTVLLNSGYTMPIMGLGTYALDENLDLLGFGLTEEEMSEISALDRGEKHDWY